MARKLLVMVAIISLVSLGQAPVSLAAIYELGQQGDDQHWTWRHGYGVPEIPWASGTEFIGGAPTYDASQADALWRIGFYAPGVDYQPFTNQEAGSQTGNTFTVKFDSTAATPSFFMNVPNVPSISSNDTIITYEAEFLYQGPGVYSIIKGTIVGTGINSSDGIPFQFIASLQDLLGNHQNIGYMKSFTLEYPYNAPAVPIPGAVWLLGTGLLGLACLGRRRRK